MFIIRGISENWHNGTGEVCFIFIRDKQTFRGKTINVTSECLDTKGRIISYIARHLNISPSEIEIPQFIIDNIGKPDKGVR